MINKLGSAYRTGQVVFRIMVIGLGLLFGQVQQAAGWGFGCHQQVTELAIYSLPKELLPLYRSQLDYLKLACLQPDKRRYVNPAEGPRHYLTTEILDRVSEQQNRPFWAQPYDSVMPRLGMADRHRLGMLPWHLMSLKQQLTAAMASRKPADILYLSAEVAHYLADAHVPLHTTANYNGQLTNQAGIHGLWETIIPRLVLPPANLMPTKAQYQDALQPMIWQTIRQSYQEVDTVLRAEQWVRRYLPPELWYTATTGQSAGIKTGRPTYSDRFLGLYADRIGPMVVRKLRLSAWSVASFWYTCWVDAGQPRLIPVREGDLPPGFVDEVRANTTQQPNRDGAEASTANTDQNKAASDHDCGPCCH